MHMVELWDLNIHIRGQNVVLPGGRSGAGTPVHSPAVGRRTSEVAAWAGNQNIEIEMLEVKL
ncbi:hypothetical protein PHLCEN_2v13378 [Hermanssonia centrifuga]|uniref:Uncharacterized protein n=1 Tax=Hermanssonia centrifuga TaxID=98765 RepID=A0A2R6NET0_9APHY|nr:hypothetical protein PHLCEN_2v13378 [Hermanssonia centrifuga]